jgi:hypothetical protein
MKFLVIPVFSLAFISSFAQNASVNSDTLQKKENAMLYLDNGFAIPPFAVSGDVYVTNESFIFHPKQYRRKRFEMYSDLVRDVILPFDSIVIAKRKGLFNLRLKTKERKFKISYSNNWGKDLKRTITLINQHVKEKHSK